jgi:hypothetical protein
MASKQKSKRGFAEMTPDQLRAISSIGGKAAHAKGTAHRFTVAEAKVAGSKGGKSAQDRGVAHRFTSEEARAAGRKGAAATRARRMKTK